MILLDFPARISALATLGRADRLAETGGAGVVAGVRRPVFEFGHQRPADLPADGQAFLRPAAVDGALDGQHGVDVLHRLQGQRRDVRGPLALGPAPGRGGDVGQFEELAPRVRPAEGFGDGAGTSVGRIERAVAAVGVGLQRQPVHALAHVGAAHRQPHPHMARHRDHRRTRALITAPDDLYLSHRTVSCTGANTVVCTGARLRHITRASGRRPSPACNYP